MATLALFAHHAHCIIRAFDSGVPSDSSLKGGEWPFAGFFSQALPSSLRRKQFNRLYVSKEGCIITQHAEWRNRVGEAIENCDVFIAILDHIADWSTQFWVPLNIAYHLQKQRGLTNQQLRPRVFRIWAKEEQKLPEGLGGLVPFEVIDMNNLAVLLKELRRTFTRTLCWHAFGILV
jgi:hypothetical protein